MSHGKCDLAQQFGADRVFSKSKFCEELIRKRLLRTKLFSWEKCANEALAAFKEALRGSKTKP